MTAPHELETRTATSLSGLSDSVYGSLLTVECGSGGLPCIVPLMVSTPQVDDAMERSRGGAIHLWPKGGPLLRYPFRFLHSRSRMLYGQPLSTRWGFDRGLPAHRYYINLFLQEFAEDFKGRCLEFQDRTYVSQFADPDRTQQDVVHIDDSNPIATIVADITKPNEIPDNAFDCVVCTHVLHLIYDFEGAIAGIHRILKPGGVLLAAVPQVSMCDESENELWRFTRLGLEQALSRVFGGHNVIARAYGNSIVAAGELRGMVADEFTRSELLTHDTCFAVEICGRAVKQSNQNNGVRGMACKVMAPLLLVHDWLAHGLAFV